MREHGFEPNPRFYESILQRESPQQYDEFCRDDTMATYFDRFAGEGGVFISPRIDITPPRLQLVIPALRREDYALRPLQQVRNADGSLYDPGIRTADIRLQKHGLTKPLEDFNAYLTRSQASITVRQRFAP
jgi:hypothetical protein